VKERASTSHFGAGEDAVADEPKIVIGEHVFTREDLFRQDEEARKRRAQLPFEEKIRILVELQKLARHWGGHDVIVWKI